VLIKRSNTYDEAYRSFRWDIPERYNIAGDVCDRHADSDAVALIHDRSNGEVHHYRFRDIQRSANQLANVFTHYNLARGSSVRFCWDRIRKPGSRTSLAGRRG